MLYLHTLLLDIFTHIIKSQKKMKKQLKKTEFTFRSLLLIIPSSLVKVQSKPKRKEELKTKNKKRSYELHGSE